MPLDFRTWAASQSLPPAHAPLTSSIIPGLLASIARIGTALRSRHHVAPAAGSPLNPFGDAQLNVDVLAEKLIRDALAACPAVRTASSEEDPVERRVQAAADADPDPDPDVCYTAAFDPLDGSSIIGPNWTDHRYSALVTAYIRAGYTLRYSGGLVPDVVHALVKGRGVYLCPVTPESPAKLRRLYELLPVALVVECAGGKAVDPTHGGRILATPVRSCDETGGLVCGNGYEVDFAIRDLTA
ncbi:hypothetical protein E4U53_007742 [Claviceps sorghi]|nr:hypothetical protein E4U53_007742 [Claviceps sorghi]